MLVKPRLTSIQLVPTRACDVCTLWVSPDTKLSGQCAVCHMFLPSLNPHASRACCHFHAPLGRGLLTLPPHPGPSQRPAYWTSTRTLNCPTHLVGDDAKALAGLRRPGSQDQCRSRRGSHFGPRGCSCLELEPFPCAAARRPRSVPCAGSEPSVPTALSCPARAVPREQEQTELGWHGDQPGTGTLGLAALSGPRCPGRGSFLLL